MGLSLTLSGIINKPEKDVTDALKSYLKIDGGDFEPAAIDKNHKNFCAIQTENGNATIIFPPYFFKSSECSLFLSKELKAAVFLLDIFDGDFWSYTLYFNGRIRDKFMPIPDYFNEDISQKEIKSWKGDARIITKYVPGLSEESVEKYLIRWNLDEDEIKAYQDDEFTNCEYQLFDFMRKLKLPYELDDDDNPKGQAFMFWSNDFPLETVEINQPSTSKSLAGVSKQKPWWKFR